VLDTTADTWYTWAGLAAASLAVGGVVAGLPTAVPPDAAAVATTVDEVAASPYDERERVTVPADTIRVDSHGIALRADGGTAHATFARGVTPTNGGRLAAVLQGVPPGRLYRSQRAFAAALQGARASEQEWRPAPDRLTIRRVTWGEVNATLVG